MVTLCQSRKTVGGNDTPLVDEKFRKAVDPRTRFKIRMYKNPLKENKLAYKGQRNLCVSLPRKCMKNRLIMKKGLTTNKNFLNFIKTFLTNKGFISHNYITPTYKNKIIADEKQLAKLFNSYYINTF